MGTAPARIMKSATLTGINKILMRLTYPGGPRKRTPLIAMHTAEHRGAKNIALLSDPVNCGAYIWRTSMSSFTPGPWTVSNLEPNTIGHDWVDSQERRKIAVCYEIAGRAEDGAYYLRVETDEIAANARLISAAPDLLAALKCFLGDERYHVSIGGNPRVVDRMVDAAFAAVAKAEGTAP